MPLELARHAYEIDGRTYAGYFADGARGSRVPGILVAHEGPGLTAHTRERARMLAELGCVAFALDLYGAVDLPLDEARTRLNALRSDRAELRRRMRAAWNELKAHRHVDVERTAAIGFCFGGMAVLELARDGAELGFVAAFHPGLDLAPQDAGRVRCKVLACIGDRDPIVGPEHREALAREMRGAGVDWQLLLLGGAQHSFTNPDIDALGFPGFAYDAQADRRAWSALRALLEEQFGTL
jgi:dienelactone hydrolase